MFATLRRREFLTLAWLAAPAAAAGWTLASVSTRTDLDTDRQTMLDRLKELEGLQPGGVRNVMEAYLEALADIERSLEPLGMSGTVRALAPHGTSLQLAVQSTEWPAVGRLDLAVSLKQWSYPAVASLVQRIVSLHPAALLAMALGQGRAELAFGIFGTTNDS